MKISLNWVKEYAKLDLPVDELVAKIGAQLGAVESVTNLGERYKGIVVAKVVSCVAHPNADKLSICLIDDGKVTKGIKRDKDGHVQVVCGAPNVRRDQLVAWCPPGITVPSTINNEPLKLTVRDIRGHKSYGMLASGHELGLNDDKSGILDLSEPTPHSTKPGMPLAKVLELNDHIIEIENKMFTHRPDCFGQLGIARELAGIQGLKFQSPDWYLSPSTKHQAPSTNELEVEVRNEVPKLVPRFMAVAIGDIKIGPSPLRLQSYLSRLGVKPINNVVDLTNYYMLLTGQPLHAYDYDKLKAQSSKPKAEIVVRRANAGERLKLLGGKVITLFPEDIVIANTQKAIGLGGIIGGADTEVGAHTKNIVLECASFDKHATHRSSMAHGLFTEASTRFSKQQSPLQNKAVLINALGDILKNTDGKIVSEIVDNYPKTAQPNQLSLSNNFVNSRLGLDLPDPEILQILGNVEFKASAKNKIIKITPPFWRTDIHIAEDIVEEVGRLYGYDRLPQILPRRNLMPAPRDQILDIKSRLRLQLAAAGANEVLNYSFVNKNLLKIAGQDQNQAFQITNALSPDLQYYRLSLIPSLLELIHPNLKSGYEEFALFEINKTHHKDSKGQALPVEEERLALVFAASDKKAQTAYSGAPYYQAAKYLTTLLSSIGIRPTFVPFGKKNYQSAVLTTAMAPFAASRSAYVLSSDGELLGIIGEFGVSSNEGLKLPSYSAGFELNVAQLLKTQNVGSSYVVQPRYPSVTQDICMRVKQSTSFAQLSDTVWEAIIKYQPANVYSQLTPVDIFGKDNQNIQITQRLSIASYERTLETALVNDLLEKVAKVAKQKLGADRI